MFKPEQDELKINLQLFAEEEDETDDTTFEESKETPSDDEQEEKSEEHQEEEYEEIVYNKETVKIPVSERKTLLQKGMNYDKVHGKLTEYEQTVKEIQELTGMDAKAVVEYLRNQQQEQEDAIAFEKMMQVPGMTEEVAKVLMSQKQEITKQEQEIKAIKQRDSKRDFDAVILNQKAELKDKPFFKELEPDIDKMIVAAPGVDAKTAYNYLRGERFDELLEQAKKTKEKSVIADLHDKAKRGITTSTESLGEDVDTSDVNHDMARAFGNDPKDIAKYVKNKVRR